MKTVFPLFTCAPISYYADLLKAENPIIDGGEHFIKQSWRNRFEIAGPNGRHLLTVHIAGSKSKTEPQSAKQLYDDYWRRQMIRSLRTAYNSSAFYMHYGIDVEDIITQPFTDLQSLNLALLRTTLDWLEIPPPTISNAYVEDADIDHRNTYIRSTTTPIPPYRQVFDDRHGFIGNLSVLDLVFNLGPAANDYLYQL